MKFDGNDWFVLGSAVVLLIVFFRLPRRFPRQLTVLIWLFNIWFVQSIDYVMGRLLSIIISIFLKFIKKIDEAIDSWSDTGYTVSYLLLKV